MSLFLEQEALINNRVVKGKEVLALVGRSDFKSFELLVHIPYGPNHILMEESRRKTKIDFVHVPSRSCLLCALLK